MDSDKYQSTDEFFADLNYALGQEARNEGRKPASHQQSPLEGTSVSGVITAHNEPHSQHLADQKAGESVEVQPPAGGDGGRSFNSYSPHIPTSYLPLFSTQFEGPSVRVRVKDYGAGDIEVLTWFQKKPPRPPKNRNRKSKTRAEMSPEQLEASQRRAITQAKDKCMMIGADRMLTFTYRENQTDRNLAYRHWAEFIKLAEKRFKSFDYVVTLERQKRGAWHFHAAVNTFYDVLALRRLWHKATGDTGAVNVTSPRKGGKWNRQKLARYLTKYMLKDEEGQEIGAKRYSSSRGIPDPEVTTYYIPAGPNTFRYVVGLIKEISGKKVERFKEVPLGVGRGTWFTTI